MAGKALKDVTSLNRCSACGNIKRAHLLCPYCVQGKPRLGGISLSYSDQVAEIKNMFQGKMSNAKTTKSDA